MISFLTLSLTTLFLFILHELEEILFMKKWFDKNADYLTDRFPRLATRIIRQFKSISTTGFAVIALQETVLLLLLLFYSLSTTRLEWWMGIILMLTLHWGITIIQSIILKRIIPGVITSILGVSFGIYIFYSFTNYIPATVYMKWGILFFIFAMANLWIMHLLVARIRKT